MLSIEKTMELHKELWMRIAELITKKDQTRNLFITDLKERALRPILEREGSEILPINYCFLCKYRDDNPSIVPVCPGTIDGLCHGEGNGERNVCLDGLYNSFRSYLLDRKWKNAAFLAEQIANIPLNEKFREKNKP